jgi:hypothetical protein
MHNRQHITLHLDKPGGGWWSPSARDVMSVCSTWNKVWVLSTSDFFHPSVIAKCFVFFLYESPTTYYHLMLNRFSFMKRQPVVTHTIRENRVPALLDVWFTNTPSVKMSCAQRKKFHKNAACLCVCLLKIGQVISVSCKTVFQSVTTNCCFLSIFLICTAP